MTNRDRIRKLTTCAMLAALGFVLLYLGSVSGVADASMAVLASLLCVFAVIEYGGSAPWLIFGVTSVLSLILLPQKDAALMYLLFFGYYPILKEKLEKRPRILSWVLKELIFHLALALLLVLMRLLTAAPQANPILLYVLLALLAEIIFPLYDLALTRLISLYLHKLRRRFRVK